MLSKNSCKLLIADSLIQNIPTTYIDYTYSVSYGHMVTKFMTKRVYSVYQYNNILTLSGIFKSALALSKN